MTSWNARQVTVTLAADLHCGYRPLGFVARTLPFVPAHIPWYAMIPPLVELSGMPDRYGSYEKLERILDSSLRFTPFFPLDGQDTPIFPWGDGKRHIETMLLGSQYGVALSYDTRGARENHLFETEVLLARSRSGETTRLRGYCFWKAGQYEDLSIGVDGGINGHDLDSLLRRSQWGGQRNKGMGAIGTVSIREASGNNPFFDNLDSGGKFPVLSLPGGAAPYFLEYNGQAEELVRGRVIPLVGKRYAPGQGFGQAADSAALVWDLGWCAAPKAGNTAVKIALANRRTALLTT